MAYIVCHAQKQKNLMSMPHHVDRIGAYLNDGSVAVYPDDYEDETLRGKSVHPQIIHPELHKWNRGGGAIFADFNRSWREEIVKVERSPQRNASLTICFNNSAGELFWVKLREEYPEDEEYYKKCEEFFKDCRVVLDELYPYGKTLKWSTHYEEKEPHMHCLKIPIILAPKRLSKKAKAEGGKPGEAILKFSSGEFLGGRKGLENLQEMIFEKVGKKWGLERGERGSDARHTDPQEWQRELSREKKELTELKKTLNDREAVVQDRESAVSIAEENNNVLAAKLEKQKAEQEEVLRTREATVKARESAADVTDKKNRDIEAKLNKQKAELEKTLKDLQNRETIINQRERFVQGAEKAINYMKKKLSGEDQIAVEVIGTLNAENVVGKERIKFYKMFFAEIKDFVKGIIKRIRNVPEQETQQKTKQEIKVNEQKPSENRY